MSISFNKKDFASIKKELLSIVPTLTERWTDFNDSDVSVVIVDLIAYLGEMLSYSLDRQALECYLSTVSDINNLRSLIKLVGMKTRFRIPATCNVRFSIPKIQTFPILIPRYSMVGVSGNFNLTYTTTIDANIAAGDLYVDIPCLEGTPKTVYISNRNFTNTNEAIVNDIYIGQGTYRLHDGQDYWTEVNSIYYTNQVGKYFSVRQNNSSTFTLEFPFDWKTLVPTDFNNFTFQYVVTHGRDGSVGANKLTELLTDIYDYNGFRISPMMKVNNLEGSSGGDEEESLDSAKRRVETNSKLMDTLVLLEDFKNFVKAYPGVGNCIAFDWSTAPKLVKRPYEIILCAITSDGLLLSQALKDKIKADMYKRKYATATPNFIDPVLKNISITGDIYFKRKILNANEIHTSIINAVKDYFAPNNRNVSFNSTIYTSDIYNVIESVSEEVSHITLTSPVSNIVCKDTEFPNLVNIDLKIHEFGTY